MLSFLYTWPVQYRQHCKHRLRWSDDWPLDGAQTITTKLAGEQRPEDEKLSETIRELYAIVNQLERDYNKHDRRFTLDGHLLGSIGEVYAAERYGIELAKSSSERHDGTTTDERKRDVQIKVTQRRSIGLSSEPAYLLVLKIDENGSFKEVFNGPGNIVWELVKNKRPPKNGQYQISLSKLRTLNDNIAPDDRI